MLMVQWNLNGSFALKSDDDFYLLYIPTVQYSVLFDGLYIAALVSYRQHAMEEHLKSEVQ